MNGLNSLEQQTLLTRPPIPLGVGLLSQFSSDFRTVTFSRSSQAHSHFNRNFKLTAALNSLQFESVNESCTNVTVFDREFVIENRAVVKNYIATNRLTGLLLEALPRLEEYFGANPVKALSLITDDEGSSTLFCSVKWAGDLEAARAALREFDEAWWLANSGKVAGKLNFDFDLI
jgi:hypothetical protein